MIRERTLKIALGLFGVLFSAAILAFLRWERNFVFEQMLASVYATLGVFLLLAVRNPSANRSLIAFTAWSSLAHVAVMAMSARRPAARGTSACRRQCSSDRARASKGKGGWILISMALEE